MTRKITVLRVNEKSLSRRYTAMQEVEAALRKENKKYRNDVVAMETAITERLGYLQRHKVWFSFSFSFFFYFPFFLTFFFSWTFFLSVDWWMQKHLARPRGLSPGRFEALRTSCLISLWSNRWMTQAISVTIKTIPDVFSKVYKDGTFS